MNTVYRKCDKCHYEDEQNNGFSYLRNGVWACHKCGAKWTTVTRVEPEGTP